MTCSWAKNLYDNEGDLYEEGILLFVGDNTILRFDDIEELKEFSNRIMGCIEEIKFG